MKSLVLLILLAIVISLGFGLFFLGKDRQGSRRMLNALKFRVALSALLILLLVLSFVLGWIAPRSPAG